MHTMILLIGIVCSALFRNVVGFQAQTFFEFGRKLSQSQTKSLLEMTAPKITGVFLKSLDLEKAKSFYGENGLGLKTSLIDDMLKVELPSKSTFLYFKEDKQCILNRPTYEWEDEFSEEYFQELLKDVESGPYAEYITEEDRTSGFKELDMEREYINARSYADGTAFYGIGITLPGTTSVFDNLAEKDHQILRFPATYMFGASLIPDEDEMIQHPVKYGIAADPDEYAVEVNEEENPHVPQERVVLCVLDTDESVEFYTKVLGFDLIRKRYNLNNRPRSASCTVYLGDKEQPKRTQLELLYRYATEKLELGVGFEKLTFEVADLNSVEKNLKEAKVEYVKGPANIQFTDLNGYQITLLKSK